MRFASYSPFRPGIAARSSFTESVSVLHSGSCFHPALRRYPVDQLPNVTSLASPLDANAPRRGLFPSSY